MYCLVSNPVLCVSHPQLKMMWGNMAPSVDEVSVPYLQPDEEEVVGVELVAPVEPGTVLPSGGKHAKCSGRKCYG